MELDPGLLEVVELDRGSDDELIAVDFGGVVRRRNTSPAGRTSVDLFLIASATRASNSGPLEEHTFAVAGHHGVELFERNEEMTERFVEQIVLGRDTPAGSKANANNRIVKRIERIN